MTNSLIRCENMRTLLWFLYSIHYINSMTSVHTIMDDTLFYYPWYDLSWRNSFSMGEIETLRLWVSCLNYFGLLELWWQCKHINWNTNLKTFGDAPWSCLTGLLVRTLLSQEIFVVSVVDLILNSKCDHMYHKTEKALLAGWQFKCLSWMMFCPV